MHTIVYFTLFLAALGGILAYPTGAPEQVCDIFTANHSNHTPQRTRPPYEIIVSSQNVAPGEVVTVTFRGLNGEKFKGFFIQGRKHNGNANPTAEEFMRRESVGEFILDSDSSLVGQIVKCGSNNNAVTHVNPEEKSSVTFQWKAPKQRGTVILGAVVVKTFELFWNNVFSKPITVA